MNPAAWRTAAALALALVVGCAEPPVVSLTFSGVVTDASSQEPVKGVEAAMVERVCVEYMLGNLICERYAFEARVGPVLTAADGHWSLAAPNKEAITGIQLRHDAYDAAMLRLWDEERESTVNEHQTALQRRAPGALGDLQLAAAPSNAGIELRFRELEVGLNDLGLILRIPDGGTASAPVEGVLYAPGDKLGDGIVIYAASLQQIPTGMDGVHLFTDGDANPQQPVGYALHSCTSIGIYGPATTASWTP